MEPVSEEQIISCREIRLAACWKHEWREQLIESRDEWRSSFSSCPSLFTVTMRISIPSIPHNENARPIIEYTVQQAGEVVAEFLRKGGKKNLIMTGAGVSVDSGIAPYRGKNGHYTIHKTYRPIFFHEFTDLSEKGHLYRQRYWSRSYLGFPPVRYALPNRTHYSVAALQWLGHIPRYITQNVDNLHHAATPSPSLAAQTILELHGTLSNVVCVSTPDGKGRPNSSDAPPPPYNRVMYERMSQSHLIGPRSAHPRAENTPTGEAYPRGCGFRGSRGAFQDVLTEWNPKWDRLARDMEATGMQPKTNPDGDVQLGGDVDYSSFNYPACPQCGGVLKPAVIFFGESVPDRLRDHSYELVDNAESMLLIGSSLATYSAFRLVKQAVEAKKPVMIVNMGPTRADSIVEDKVELGSSDVMSATARLLAGSRPASDPVLKRLLESGVSIEPTQRVVSS